MINTSLTIMRKLEKEGEMKVSDISLLLPKKYQDHRDYYPFASLITQGFVEDSMLERETTDKNPDYKTQKLQLLVWKLFAISNAAENKAEYKGRHWAVFGGAEKLSDQLYSLSGLGYLYLDEVRNKNTERRFAFLIAIFSAVSASVLTYYLAKL